MLLQDINEIKTADFLAGVTVLVDKPLEWTSFDVVNKIRYALKRKLGVKKIKVGHAGTLDPLATGLLIIAIGKDTKLINNYQDLDKTYEGTIKLGATTPSFDAEFEPDKFYPTEHITVELIEQTRKSFIGFIQQIPPKFSAVKVNGETAYRLARKGVEFEIKRRTVKIHQFDIVRKGNDELIFAVKCQKGTYIRTLADDFGKALNSGAYLTGLRRSAIGNFNISQALNLDDLITILNSTRPQSH